MNPVIEKRQIKAFMIARVSDPSQRDALPAQELRLREYAERNNLDAEILSFDETAYKTDRLKFQEIVKRISKHPEFCIVVFDKIDRFTRDSSSDVVRILKSLVKEGRIELHFPSDNLVYHRNSPAADKTRLGIGIVFGEYYSAAISDNVKRKIQQKLHDKEWPGKAPIGYKNVDIEVDGKLSGKGVISDPDRHASIRKIYELRLQGISFRVIARMMREDGLVSNTKSPKAISASMVENILKNPFYYGMMRYDGKLYPHKYEPIISKLAFDEVQKISEDRSKGGAKPITDLKRAYTFNALLKCKRCGCSISSYVQKGHTYMHCSKAKYNCGQTHSNEPHAEKQMIKILKTIRPSQEILDQVLEELQKEHNNEQEYYKNVAADIKRDQGRTKKRLEVIYEDRLEGRITTEEYDRIAQDYKEKIENLDRKLVQVTSNDNSFIIDGSYLIKLAYRAPELFESSKPELKNRLLKIVLSNLEIDDKILFYKRWAPFNVISECLKSSNWLRRLDSNQ